MKLLTKELQRKLPGFNEVRGESVAVAKFFAPWSNWTWYAAEYDPATRTFWGLVHGVEVEYGCFSLDELESLRGLWGLRVERDKFFKPTPLGRLE
ncbi:DUF2958 domain-containing protein [Streptomyces sp. NBC_01373]|uniref:DUF2958 domain-containing protein n=1 Tax=Streptomyces sp. NBC_01373 TaxID=2903843 RepID=UPI002255D553|nr:DUF2958 domain-containing protein [Streptomyces sp. NBC_01373]MCX4699006.1 DUF2958 domain-containing protein [Streptomyces sp. NBC_01373]